LKLIDTNVFLYAVGREHLYREPCRRLLKQIDAGTVAANVDADVLQEVMHVFRRRNQVPNAVDVVTELMQMFPDCLPVTVTTVGIAADVLLANPHLDARDAIHAAVVLEHGLEGIVSADKGFDAVDGIKRFDPREY
jgi:predicted nucleic acid-binding protein